MPSHPQLFTLLPALSVVVSCMFPQSHWNNHKDFSLLLPIRSIAVRRPNRWPEISLTWLFMPHWWEQYFWPFLKKVPRTTTTFPQSHAHVHEAFFCESLAARPTTIRLPNRLPLRSFSIPLVMSFLCCRALVGRLSFRHYLCSEPSLAHSSSAWLLIGFTAFQQFTQFFIVETKLITTLF